MAKGGTYALVIFLQNKFSLQVGKLGVHDFPTGYYIYAGSALGGLFGRLRHHLKSDKRLHWHIDYFLQQAKVAQIWYALGQDRLECKWNAILADLQGATPIIPGFGASDCCCHTHLTHLQTRPSLNIFRQKLRQNKLPQVYRINDLANL
jgi:Uri superfamily endonuclease